MHTADFLFTVSPGWLSKLPVSVSILLALSINTHFKSYCIGSIDTFGILEPGTTKCSIVLICTLCELDVHLDTSVCHLYVVLSVDITVVARMVTITVGPEQFVSHQRPMSLWIFTELVTTRPAKKKWVKDGALFYSEQNAITHNEFGAFLNGTLHD